MGGLLSNPADEWPGAFGNPFFRSNPYFLACALVALFAFIPFVLSFFLLKEVRIFNFEPKVHEALTISCRRAKLAPAMRRPLSRRKLTHCSRKSPPRHAKSKSNHPASTESSTLTSLSYVHSSAILSMHLPTWRITSSYLSSTPRPSPTVVSGSHPTKSA